MHIKSCDYVAAEGKIADAHHTSLKTGHGALEPAAAFSFSVLIGSFSVGRGYADNMGQGVLVNID